MMELNLSKFLFGFHFRALAIIFFLTCRLSECVLFQDKIIDDNPMSLVVVTGSTARLPCSVDPKYTEQYSDHFKVMWVSPRETPISMQDRRIINDQRISIERPLLKDWDLFIRNVSLDDAGTYKCQINTDPVRTKEITLKVKAPPKLIDHSVPLVIERSEGEKVELYCNATGSPNPNITWYRLNRNGDGSRERVGNVGESLVIHNITRVCGDTYECVADNGVPPAVSQTFKVSVLYAPEVTLPNSRLGQKTGRETILECEVYASPLGNAVWKKNGRTLVNTKNRELTLYNINPTEGVVLNLRIRTVTDADFGKYECEATNGLGTASSSMELYELRSRKKTTTTSTTTSSTTTRRHKWRNKGRNKDVINVHGGGNRDSQAWGNDKWDSYYSNNGAYNGKDDHPTPGRSSHTGVNPHTGGQSSADGDGNAASRLVQVHSPFLVRASTQVIIPLILSSIIRFIIR